MLSIKINDPQPIECQYCKEKHGFFYSDYMSLHYTSIHTPEGKYEGGQYSDGYKILNKGKTAFCTNCAERLPFKLNREDFEDVS
jgi:hypothetical protein